MTSTWDRRWRETDAFAWQLDDPPDELAAFLSSRPQHEGLALDLGCGDGKLTKAIAAAFTRAYGLDIAPAAARRARETSPDGSPVSFVAADATAVPFADRSFSFVFDRGCLQNVPRDRWADYFSEVDRVLAAGGSFQVYCSRGHLPRPGTLGRVKARLKHAVGRRPPPLGARIRACLPSSFLVLESSEFPFTLRDGRVRMFSYLLARKP